MDWGEAPVARQTHRDRRVMNPSGPAKSMDGDTLGWALAQAEGAPARDLSGATLGDFRVEKLLGRGGMGEVYLAQQLSLGRPVALKVLRPDLLSSPASLARFEAEAATAARLNHPNIVHIYAVGGEGRARYIAMEYVPGWTLREYLERKGRPDLRLAFSIMRQATLAVGAAGEVGLVHRDIKPENLLMTRKGLVKVADFGLCRVEGASRPEMTQAGVTVGTPLYMSPEQVQGRPLDHRSDLYSLGVTFYHMLAGSPPFRGEASLAVAMRHVHEAPVSLGVHRPDLPEELLALVMKLLAKDPADRPQRADEVLADLARAREAALHLLGPPAGPAIPAQEGASASIGIFGLSLKLDGPTPSLSPSPSPSRAVPAEAAPARRGPGAAWLAAALAGGLAVGVAAAWLSRGEDVLSDAAAPVPAGPPGAWMFPAAAGVRHRATAEEQYRYAQIEAPPADREAAWLAVPGRFPGDRDHEWALRAYVQLVRHLLRLGDRSRLAGLAAELERSGRADYVELSKVSQAAAAALGGQAESVNAEIAPLLTSLKLNPPLAELALEVILRVMNPAPGSAPPSLDLTPLRNQLADALKVSPGDLARGPARPG